MQPQPRHFTWPQHKLYRDVCTVINENDITSFHRSRLKNKLRKLRDKGALTLPNMPEEWLYRLCAASLMHRDYHWTGWECRNEVAHKLAHQGWLIPKWDGRPCRLIVLAEQGIGDEILFASCYADLIRDNPDTVIECDHRLIPVFERSFGVECVSRWSDDAFMIPRPLSESRGDFDAFIPAGEVIKLYRRSRRDFPKAPFLHADPERVERWRDYLAGPAVGVSWWGRMAEIDPELLRSGGRNISVQYGGHSVDWAEDPPQANYDDTFALVAALTEVRTTTTAIAHVAGSMGVPVVVVKPPRVHGELNNSLRWHYGLGGSSDWYPSMTVFPSEAVYASRGT